MLRTKPLKPEAMEYLVGVLPSEYFNAHFAFVHLKKMDEN